MTILLVDDEPDFRVLVGTTLLDPRYRILEAANAREAIELVHSQRPDIMILDWVMPGMDGLQLVRELREEDSLREMRIIMLTAKGRERDREQARSLGITSYLVKPFSPRELLERIEQLIDRM